MKKIIVLTALIIAFSCKKKSNEPKPSTPETTVNDTISNNDTTSGDGGNTGGTGSGNGTGNTGGGNNSNTVADIDGNVYQTVVIGCQTWMAEDLRVTKFSNGDPITGYNTDSLWNVHDHNNPAYSHYVDTYSTCATGMDTNRLYYNFIAVTDQRNVCPDGWHIPSKYEVTDLFDTCTLLYAVGDDAGGKLKSIDDVWCQQNIGATDEYGFSSKPTNYRVDNGGGEFLFINVYEPESFYWTNTTNSSNGETYNFGSVAWDSQFRLRSENVHPSNQYGRGVAMACRCVKD